jgi:aspartate/methionine/tyrosine aminotransferase
VRTVKQAAIPVILTPQSAEHSAALAAFHSDYMQLLQNNAEYCVRRFSAIPGLDCTAPPQGAMYALIGLRFPTATTATATATAIPATAGNGTTASTDWNDDTALAVALMAEQAVSVLPGVCFGAPGYFRVVFSAPQVRHRLLTCVCTDW